MKRNSIFALARATGYATKEEQAREALLEAEGPRAAAWLVREHKKQLRKSGAVDFQIPTKVELPMWMSLAFETLRRRGWYVAEVPTARKGLRAIRVARECRAIA